MANRHFGLLFPAYLTLPNHPSSSPGPKNDLSQDTSFLMGNPYENIPLLRPQGGDDFFQKMLKSFFVILIAVS